MDSTWANILWFMAIGGFFVMMMRRGGCCCGGAHRQRNKSGTGRQTDTKNAKDLTLESVPVNDKSTEKIRNRSET